MQERKMWKAKGDSVVDFDSLPEAVDFMKRTSPLPINRGVYYAAKKNHEDSPDWSYSLEKCYTILSNPPDCIEKIMELSENISFEKIALPRNKLRRNLYEGELIDVQGCLNRQRNCFVASKIAEQPRRTAKILINLSSSCDESLESLYYRASAAIAIADSLESISVRVQLDVVESTTHIYSRDNRLCGIKSIRTCLKKYEDPLDINTASAITDLKFVRGFFIQMFYVLAPKLMDKSGGWSCEPPNDVIAGYDVYMGRDLDSKYKVEELLKNVAEKFDLGEYKEIA